MPAQGRAAGSTSGCRSPLGTLWAPRAEHAVHLAVTSGRDAAGMSMSDAFLPVPPEDAADAAARSGEHDFEEDRGPDVLPGPEEDDAERAEAADADQPERFRTPRAGDRLSAAELQAELDPPAQAAPIRRD
jgi:hypothetical protein